MREKKIIIITSSLIEIYSLAAMYRCFFLSTFAVKPHSICCISSMCTKASAEKKIFSMINRRAIYCDLIDFLCGKQLKRSSCARGMKTLIEKWFELCSIYKQPSAILFFLLSISIQLYLWHMLLKD